MAVPGGRRKYQMSWAGGIGEEINMKVSLWLRHDGLGRLLIDLLSDHQLVATPDDNNRLYSALSLPVTDGTEDVRISTIPHHDLNTYDDDKPTIAYITDPIYPTAQPAFDRWLKKKNFHCIGAEDCYSERLVPPYESLIPYAVTGYPTYAPSIDKVLVVNRRPDHRLKEITLGVCKKAMTMAEVLDRLPWVLANEPDQKRFKQMYADHKVLFYFSNSPFTIVLFEAMTVGMPIVGFKAAYRGRTEIMERYLPSLSADIGEVRRMLRAELDRRPPSPPIDYGIPRFEDVKRQWNSLLESIR